MEEIKYLANCIKDIAERSISEQIATEEDYQDIIKMAKEIIDYATPQE